MCFYPFSMTKKYIQLFQLTLSEENQKAYKPRPQGNMGSFKSVFITAVQV